ncbi:thyrotropin-releasing hormone-degrading ectoenzyme-like [Harpegnathos saltator]|uniref:thyrotropin-releasing hormone-degrading ectoenzyme-like n=1 Tax=Harpegnathos saltator TaxID=610380 RepID=UPI00059132A8|nr:thyrotropin-releasing hormone-degrading ectoenzyme-like [Harpegnathos saltator]
MGTIYLRIFCGVLLFNLVDLLTIENIEKCTINSGRINLTKVAPIGYKIKLYPSFTFEMISVITDIKIQVEIPTADISFHIRNPDLKNALCIIYFVYKESDVLWKCNDEKNEVYRPNKLRYCAKHEVLTLSFSDLIPEGEHVLHIENNFHWKKSHIVYPKDLTKDLNWIIINLYNSYGIRELFPCWDQTELVSSFSITVQHNKLYTILSNNNKVDVLHYGKTDKGLQTTIFDQIPYLSPFSIAFVIAHDLKKYDSFKYHRLWRRSKIMELSEYASSVIEFTALYFYTHMNITDKILQKHLPKIDHVLIPDSPIKSMGKYGLIVYREKDVTYNKTSDFPSKRVEIAKLITYEIARQMFSNLPKQYPKEIWWMNEIIASFFNYYILTEFTVWEKKAMELFVVQNLQTALDSDIYLEREPIIHKVKDDNGIDGLLYPLLYHKKAFALIRMMLHLVGPLKFHAMIKEYLMNVIYVDWSFFEFLGKFHETYYGGYTIKEIMDSWLMERHHPEIHFSRDYKNEVVKYSASYFNENSKYKIPITYSIMSNFDSFNTGMIIWYNGTKTQLITNVSSNYIFIANIEQIGYYRVNYDKINWLLLSDYLQRDGSTQIHVLNRAQIINDAFYFTTIGKLNIDIFFIIIRFLKYQLDYIVWYPMFNILSYMSTYLECPKNAMVKIVFLDIFDGLLKNIINQEKDNKDKINPALVLLGQKWACKLGHEECRNVIRDKFQSHLFNNTEYDAIPQWKEWMFCTGIMTLNITLWQNILHLAIEQKNMMFFEYLSCSDNEDIIIYYLNLILNTNLGTEAGLNMGKIYRSIVKKHVRKNAVLKYVLLNYKKALTRFPAELDNNILLSDILMNVYCEEQFHKIEGIIIHFVKDIYIDRSIFNIWSEERQNQISKVQKKFKHF